MSSVNAAELSAKSKSAQFKIVGPIWALILILTGSVVGAAPSPQIPSFSQTYSTLQKLSKDTGSGNREVWLQVIRSFLSIHETLKDPRMANRSLFLAGKASIELYRRSGKVEDLDEAIRHLSRFSDLNRRGPNLILGLRELKEAHILKRKTLDIAPWNANGSLRANPGQTSPQDVSWHVQGQAAKKSQRAVTANRSANALSSGQNSTSALRRGT